MCSTIIHVHAETLWWNEVKLRNVVVVKSKRFRNTSQHLFHVERREQFCPKSVSLAVGNFTITALEIVCCCQKLQIICFYKVKELPAFKYIYEQIQLFSDVNSRDCQPNPSAFHIWRTQQVRVRRFHNNREISVAGRTWLGVPLWCACFCLQHIDTCTGSYHRISLSFQTKWMYSLISLVPNSPLQ